MKSAKRKGVAPTPTHAGPCAGSRDRGSPGPVAAGGGEVPGREASRYRELQKCESNRANVSGHL